MKTFIANETLLLIEGEVYLTSKEYPSKNDYIVDGYGNIGVFKGHEEKREWLLVEYKKGLCSEDLKNVSKIVASTKQLPNVKQLPREVFVKGVDVKIEAEKFLPKVYSEWEFELFEAGYNANKNEFSMQQMMRAMNLSFTTGALNGDKTSQDILNMIQPLSLPIHVETDDEFNITKVVWETTKIDEQYLNTLSVCECKNDLQYSNCTLNCDRHYLEDIGEV